MPAVGELLIAGRVARCSIDHEAARTLLAGRLDSFVCCRIIKHIAANACRIVDEIQPAAAREAIHAELERENIGIVIADLLCHAVLNGRAVRAELRLQQSLDRADAV